MISYVSKIWIWRWWAGNIILEKVFMTTAGECSQIFCSINWNGKWRNLSASTAGIPVPEHAAVVENKTWSETGRSGISLQLRKPDGPWWKCGGQYLREGWEYPDHIRKKRKSIIKRYQTKRTVGHTGIARECFAQRGNRTRSPHFKRELSGGSMSLHTI